MKTNVAKTRRKRKRILLKYLFLWIDAFASVTLRHRHRQRRRRQRRWRLKNKSPENNQGFDWSAFCCKLELLKHSGRFFCRRGKNTMVGWLVERNFLSKVIIIWTLIIYPSSVSSEAFVMEILFITFCKNDITLGKLALHSLWAITDPKLQL